MMHNNQAEIMAPPESKKRKLFPHELYGKFSAKSDFIKYFREQLQLYLPPDHM